MPAPQKDGRKTDREEARAYLVKKIEREEAILADPRAFVTISPHHIIEDAKWRLRWIDCAPEGARFGLAPLQDKNGIPCGGTWDENVGPNQAMRAARLAHGRNPFGGDTPFPVRSES